MTETIAIQKLVFCPKEDSDVELETCEECEHNCGSDNYEVECNFRKQ